MNNFAFELDIMLKNCKNIMKTFDSDISKTIKPFEMLMLRQVALYFLFLPKKIYKSKLCYQNYDF